MAFTPHRPAPAYVLSNVANGQAINLASITGVNNAMKHLANRGRLLTCSGARVNGRVIPVIGYAYPDTGTFRVTRKQSAIPYEIPPNDTHFCLFFNYRANLLGAATGYFYGTKLTVEIVKGGTGYVVGEAVWNEETAPFYLNSKLVVGKLPIELSLSPIDTETVYLRLTFDGTWSVNLAGVVLGSYDPALNAGAAPMPNISTYWAGIGSLSFATFRDCGGC